MKTDSLKTKSKKIIKIVIFFNNYRGLLLSKFLKARKYKTFNVLTKKFLNKEVLKRLKKSKNFKLIKDLKNKALINFLKEEKFDLIVAAGFPHLFKKEYFKLTRYGIINLHAGKLPKYRGGSPLNWQIINNEKKIGLSVIKVDKKIDHGPIICETSFKNLKTDDINISHNKANKLFLNLTLKAIKIIGKNIKLKKQNHSSSYFKQRKDEDSKINFNASASNVYNFVRALSFPYKGAFFKYKNKKFRILKCKINNYPTNNMNPGRVFKIKKKKIFFIKCKNQNISVLKSKPDLKIIKKIEHI